MLVTHTRMGGLAILGACALMWPAPDVAHAQGFQFAGNQVQGIVVVKRKRIGHRFRTVRLGGDDSFLSPPNLCNFLGNRQTIEAQVVNDIRQLAQQQLPSGFGTHSETSLSLSSNCDARAETRDAGGGDVTATVRLSGNVLSVRVTTPDLIPGAFDPKFAIRFDSETRLVIAVPRDTSQSFFIRESITRTMNTSAPDPKNIPGGVAVVLNAIVRVVTGDDLLARLSQNRQFRPKIDLPLSQMNGLLRQNPGKFFEHSVDGQLIRLRLLSSPPQPFFPDLH
jgi:hypothetical protein